MNILCFKIIVFSRYLKCLYQINTKFRDEIRPRFGVMRGREFLMKDAYSMDIDKESAIKTYNKVFLAYMRTFKDMGLNVIPLAADSTAALVARFTVTK